MSADNVLSAEYVRNCVRYENGKLFWLVRPVSHFVNSRMCKAWNTRFAGKEAGTIRKLKGGDRSVVVICFKPYYRSRLVWLLHNGQWPVYEVDHINRNQLDDRITNLRAATHRQNGCNRKMRCDNTSGIKGVSRSKNKWVAQININGKNTNLGYFTNLTDASNAYRKSAKIYHGEFACTN